MDNNPAGKKVNTPKSISFRAIMQNINLRTFTRF